MDKINQINEQIIKKQEESIELLKSLLKTKDLIINELKEQLSIADVVGQSERLPCELCSGSGFIHDDYIGTGICSYCNE